MQSSLTEATFSRPKYLFSAYINTIDIQIFSLVFQEFNEFVVVIVYAEMGI